MWAPPYFLNSHGLDLSFLFVICFPKEGYSIGGEPVGKIVKWFLNGLLVILPIGVTIYLLTYLFTFIDNLGKKIISLFTAHPINSMGIGVVLTLALITLVGFISQLWLSKKIIYYTEKLIDRFPGLKTIYNMTKETIQSLIGEKKAFSQAVLITEEDGAKRVGFLTSENVTSFGLDESYIAVYIPHGLQVSGELKLYPREKVEPLNVTVEEAMRFCLTAGVGAGNSKEVS